jgi:hypothetical protein
METTRSLSARRGNGTARSCACVAVAAIAAALVAVATLATSTLATSTLATSVPAAEPGREAERSEPSAGFTPKLVTEATRSDAARLAALTRPGTVVFRDDFESPESLKKYFEISGLREGNARRETDAGAAHSGGGALRLTAVARDGRASGVGAFGWLGAEGYDRLYFRRYVKFASDYDQGNLNHVGGGMAAVAGADRFRAMGSAGIRPRGDDHFNSSFEPWRDWGRYAPPGYMFLYTYWMDMQRDRDGNYWGTMLGPAESQRKAPKRDRWYCLEHMIRANAVGRADGELAAWIDGELYLHYTGIRWRTSDRVKLKRFDLGLYVHRATRDNTVWYDDVALSTGYIGPK